jgi:hypothetical protein
MAAGNTYVPIAEQTLGSSASSITFSSIPSAYTDLVLIMNGVLNNTNTYYVMYYNGDSTLTNYSSTGVYGNGTSALSERNGYIKLGYSGSATVPVTSIINIQNYSNTSTYKTNLMRFANTNDNTYAGVGLWRNTAAINSITIYSYYGGSFNTGATFSLYGISAA